MNEARKPPRFPLAGEGEAHPLETVALWALGAAIALGVLVWLTGEVAARVFNGVWPRVDVAEMGRVLAQLRAHAGDPGKAWPVSARAAIPGPAEFYGTLAVLLTPLVACPAGTAPPLVFRLGRSERALGASTRPSCATHQGVASGTAHARPRRRPPRRRRRAPVGDRGRAGANRQNIRLRRARDPGMAGAGCRDLREDGLAARDVCRAG